jgi:hypothetical protein
MQLGMDQMHLAQIGLGGIPRHPRAVFDRLPQVRVTPSPVSSRMPASFGLIIVCVALRLTAVTTPFIARPHVIGTRRFDNSASLICRPRPGSVGKMEKTLHRLRRISEYCVLPRRRIVQLARLGGV